jgi:hypothetical protein
MYRVPLEPPRPRPGRELAERSSNGTQVRLLWEQRTAQLWVEVWEPDEQMLVIPVQPQQALDAFHHPYAYAASHRLASRSSRPPTCECSSRKEDL